MVLILSVTTVALSSLSSVFVSPRSRHLSLSSLGGNVEASHGGGARTGAAPAAALTKIGALKSKLMALI